jgi:exopolysaccharide biosynthesis protein
VDYGDFGSSFPAVFTDGEVISTDTVYQSENVSVTTTTYSTDNLTFYVQDIYIKNIENFKTAFAKDTYGKSIAEWSLTIAISHNAIASINGDYYGIHGDGIVIRNGYVYRNVKDDNDDVCVIYWDGTMKVISAQNFDIEQVIADGAYQAWSFGPGLLNDDGSAKTNFNSSIAKANPRSAIGYYEPGHYCFVAVDGRNENGSNGATLVLLAQIMESLDCSVAYNLDGGKSSAMTFGDELVNTPCDGGREDTDIIYIAE